MSIEHAHPQPFSRKELILNVDALRANKERNVFLLTLMPYGQKKQFPEILTISTIFLKHQ